VLVDGEIQVLILVPDAMSEKLEFLSNDYVLVDGEIQVLILVPDAMSEKLELLSNDLT
jgi:hypothetical protein